MTDRTWFTADYSPGWINGGAVVLVRGSNYYPERFSRDDLPWRVHATCADMDAARQIVRLLNDAATL